MPTRTELTGPKAVIELFVFDDDSCPARAYLDELDPRERQRIDSLFELMCMRGEIRNKEHFKKLEGSDGIFEFKRYQTRVLCFFGKGSPARVVLTNGVTKKSDKHAKSDIRRAEDMRKRYMGERK